MHCWASQQWHPRVVNPDVNVGANTELLPFMELDCLCLAPTIPDRQNR